MIPAQNIVNTMLKTEVVEAVRAGKFHIYAVHTVDEGVEVLTGLAAGAAGPDGVYPEGTLNFLVRRRLRELAERLRRFAPSGSARASETKNGESKKK